MATKIVMEALSPTMEEGRLVEWKRQEGDAVAEGDVIAEVETDKAVMELVARASGTLLRQVVAAGATVPVAEVVGYIGEPGEVIEGTAPKKPAKDKGPVTAKAKEEEPEETKEEEEKEEKDVEEEDERPEEAKGTKAPVSAEDATATGGRVKASPLARKMATERGLPLGTITGSGPEGRIVKRDVESAPPLPLPPATPAGAAAPRAPTGTAPAFEDQPLSQIRKAIARRLAQSIGPIPTFYLTADVDMERAADARASLNDTLGDRGRISFNDILLKALASALVQHPACNAWWQDDHIRLWREVHLGMAVAIPDGLITPVIRHADRKGLLALSAEARDLATRARERKLAPEEYTGSTFSISNLGMFDIDHFTAIINPPEAGILAVGRIAAAPTVVEGAIVPRRRMRMTMSCDHRVIDGATGADFLRTLTRMLENPLALVL